jgi:hypothetical protein
LALEISLAACAAAGSALDAAAAAAQLLPRLIDAEAMDTAMLLISYSSGAAQM